MCSTLHGAANIMIATLSSAKAPRASFKKKSFSQGDDSYTIYTIIFISDCRLVGKARCNEFGNIGSILAKLEFFTRPFAPAPCCGVRHALAARWTFFPSSNFKFVSGDLTLTGF